MPSASNDMAWCLRAQANGDVFHGRTARQHWRWSNITSNDEDIRPRQRGEARVRENNPASLSRVLCLLSDGTGKIEYDAVQSVAVDEHREIAQS